MTEEDTMYWQFTISVSDCAGAMTSVAAAFSNEDVNIDITVGKSLPSGENGLVIIGFESSTEVKDILVRRIERLTKVISLQHQPSTLKEVSENISEQIKHI